MLNDNEFEDISRRLHVTAEILGHELKSTVVMVMLDDLQTYPHEAICQALTRVRREHAGKLTLKSIVDRIRDPKARPSASEAWAIALPSHDEAATVVWTDEISQAWSVALPVLEMGDKVGARMAFIGAYDRICAAALSENKTPKWAISQGWDPKLRDVAVSAAQCAGLLPAPKKEPVLQLVHSKKPNPTGISKVKSCVSNMLNEMRIRAENDKRERKENAERQRAERIAVLDQQLGILKSRQAKN